MNKVFVVSITCDNAAFEENCEAEIARILARIRFDIVEGKTEGIVRDANGNIVGNYFYKNK